MHSSRMHTAHFSAHLEGGGVCLSGAGGVSARRGCLARGGVCLGGVCLGSVCQGGCLPGECLPPEQNHRQVKTSFSGGN